MKVGSIIGGGILFASLMVPTAITKNGKKQASNDNLTFVGTATLTPPGTRSRTRAESRKGPKKHQVDLPAARLKSAHGAPPAKVLTLPTPADNGDVDNANVRGFTGLTHLDQWSAGTGIYADSQSIAEPPDQALAVGNGFVLEAVNAALAVYDQRGRLLAGPTAFNEFFGLAPEISATGEFGDFVTDPECYFDQQTQRWFITIAQIDVDPSGNFIGPRAHILIAVSKSNDPRGGFNLFRIDATDDGGGGTPLHSGCPCFGDQPRVGADTNGFYISTNEFNIAFLNGGSTFFNGAQIYAMSKTRLAAGNLSPVVHFADLSLAEGVAGSIIPAKPLRVRQTNDGPGGVEYFLSALDFFNQLDNRIAVWALSNTASLSTPTPDVELTKVIITSETYGFPPSAEQRPGPTPLRDFFGDIEPIEKLHTNDDRMQQVVFADGKLWAGLNTVVQQRNGLRAGIAFFSVAPSMPGGTLQAKIADQGYLSVRGNDVLNPAIGLDSSGNAVMVFTLTGPDFFPSAAFANITDKKKKFKVRIAGPGVAPEDSCFGYNSCLGVDGIAPWGDYSAATADENGNIWVATEFIPAKSSGIPGTGTFLAHWGTFVARIAEEDNP